MTEPYWHCTRNTHGWSMPKRQVPTLPLTSCSPATLRRLQPALVAAACAGKMLNGSVRAKCSAGQWVMPGPRMERQGAGNPGHAALGVDGARPAQRSTHSILCSCPRRSPGVGL